jgi:large subunit ribosomal protein L25
MHPWKQIILHIDFQRVDERTRVHKKVPLHFENEENSVAVKTDKCLVNRVMTEIEVECLASQLPEFITVDLGDLIKGQSIHARDLKLPPGIKAVRHGTQNPVIVAAVPPRVEEEEPEAAAPVVAAAAPTKAKKTEKQNKK